MLEVQMEWESWWSAVVLFTLLLLSAFFSGSETAMNSVNRYRLAHRARSGQQWATRAGHLLHRPDRLLGMILVGNNIANIVAAALVTLIATQIWGQGAVPIAGALLTLVILIFAEVMPKSLAASRPEQIVRLVVNPLRYLMWLLWPVVVLVNRIAGLLMKPFHFSPSAPSLALNERELRVLLETAGEMIPQGHLHTLLRVLGLSELTVADAMVPHTTIDGVDLEDSIEDIRSQLQSAVHSRMPVYRRSIDDVIGFLSLRSLSQYLGKSDIINKAVLENSLSPPVFVPETTPLHEQIKHFREEQYHMALVVDEYGAVRGLLTIWDLISEIIGDAPPGEQEDKWQPSPDGTMLFEGTAQSREINRVLDWKLPDHDEARTLNGLIVEELEMIPHGNVCLELGDYRLETLHIEEQGVRQVRVWKKAEKN